jgi:ketosteroid isomerase-like protein
MEPKAAEVVAAIYTAWNAGEWGLEHFHPNVEWELAGQGTIDQAGASRGRDSLLDYWRRFWAAWKPGARWEIEELERTAEDQVLASGRLLAVGRSSGLRTSAPVFHLWTVSESLVVHLRVCDDRETALNAAGPSNQP